MKNWTNAEIVSIELTATAYGSADTVEFDDIYVNAEGKWEGTFGEAS